MVWTKDASQAALVAAHLMNKDTSAAYRQALEEEYEQMRSDAKQTQEPSLSLDEARKRKLNLF